MNRVFSTAWKERTAGLRVLLCAILVLSAASLVACTSGETSETAGKQTQNQTQTNEAAVAFDVALSKDSDGSYFVSYSTQNKKPVEVRYALDSGEKEARMPKGAKRATSVSSNGRLFAKLDILKPDSTYIYQVGDLEPVTFSTVSGGTSTSGQSSQTFTFLGDTQGDPDTEEVIVSALLKDLPQPQAVILAGDLVNEPSQQDQWKTFFEQMSPVIEQVPVFAAPGNHTQEGIFTPPGTLAGFGYADLDQTRIVWLDSNLMGTLDKDTVTDIKSFLDEAVVKSPVQNTIVVMHHPLYPMSANPKDAQRAKTMRENYLAQLTHSSLILCGHEHMYSRVEAGGIVQVMGDASRKVYEADQDQQAKALVAQPVSTVLKIDGSSITGTTYDLDKKVVDSFAVSK